LTLSSKIPTKITTIIARLWGILTLQSTSPPDAFDVIFDCLITFITPHRSFRTSRALLRYSPDIGRVIQLLVSKGHHRWRWNDAIDCGRTTRPSMFWHMLLTLAELVIFHVSLSY
jgi:hypothetical protein